MDHVNTDTGELVRIGAAPFSLTEYVSGLTSSNAIGEQKSLAAAYDAACEELVGPNDVQMEGTRSFKKKSAWRKLARYFNISVEIVRVEREILPDAQNNFLATVTARAVAPWGQRYEEVGACCTDEAMGRRVITVADAIATASTRASNRAVSNLIAMGEVSAEEIQKGDPTPRAASPSKPSSAPSTSGPSRGGGDVMPFGKHKGVPLADVSIADLQSTIDWCNDTNAEKFAKLIATIEAEQNRRITPASGRRVPSPAAATISANATVAAPKPLVSSDGYGADLPDPNEDDLPFSEARHQQNPVSGRKSERHAAAMAEW